MRFDVNRLVVGKPYKTGYINTSNMNTVIVYILRSSNKMWTSKVEDRTYYNSLKVDYISKDYILVNSLILLRHEVRLW
jgi:hypothetical protein